jgi:kynurenine formamidase
MRFFDLAHPVVHGMTTCPGLPGPVVDAHLSREASRAHYGPGTEFHIGRIAMIGNTGTYIDAPFHRHADGADLAALPLERTANLPVALVRRAPGAPRAIGPEAFAGLSLAGRAVLVQTGHARHWGGEAYFHDLPYLTREAAELLCAAGAALAGIDAMNIDSTADPARPVHTLLLGAGVPIVENLTGLDALPGECPELRFFAVPAPVRALGSLPVRAFALAP